MRLNSHFHRPMNKMCHTSYILSYILGVLLKGRPPKPSFDDLQRAVGPRMAGDPG